MVSVMGFNTTFNNILVDETGVMEITTDQSQVTDKLYHIMRSNKLGHMWSGVSTIDCLFVLFF